jgi:hypothetical protein
MDAAAHGGISNAKSAVDIACWDLRGKAADCRSPRFFGGVLQKDFPLYEAVPLGSPESMASFAGAASLRGSSGFQLKVGNNPREDAARNRAVVETVTGDTIVIADSKRRLEPARRAHRDELHGRSFLSSRAAVPHHRGQRLSPRATASFLWFWTSRSSTLSDVYEAKRSAGVSSINIKISRVGGITGAALMRDVMQELDLMVSVEDMWGGDPDHRCGQPPRGEYPSGEPADDCRFMNDWTDGHVAGYRPSVGQRPRFCPTPRGPGLGIEDRHHRFSGEALVLGGRPSRREQASSWEQVHGPCKLGV